MSLLLVNTPQGIQEIISVGEGGGYFDEARILWDERIDGPLPVITLGGMVRSGDTLILDQSLLNAHIAKLAAEAKQDAIDTAIRGFEAEAKAISEGYSQAEIDTFPTQEAEANAYALDNTAPTPLLDAIISESGEVKALLVTSILGNAAAMKVAVGMAIGRKQKKIKDTD